MSWSDEAAEALHRTEGLEAEMSISQRSGAQLAKRKHCVFIAIVRLAWTIPASTFGCEEIERHLLSVTVMAVL